MSDCLFCRILAGEIPGTFVLEEERCVAFLDINPINLGHVLVVPRAHAQGLQDLDPEDAAAMMQAALRIATAIRSTDLPCDAVNLHLADGRAAGQEILHAHLHVIPRVEGDGFGLKFHPDYGKSMPKPDDLRAVADLIRAEL